MEEYSHSPPSPSPEMKLPSKLPFYDTHTWPEIQAFWIHADTQPEWVQYWIVQAVDRYSPN